MNIIEIIAQDLFDKVRSRFTNLQMGNEDGAVTSNPKDARFFDFDFVLEGNNLGRVSISINERGTLKIFYSQGITEGTDTITRQLWYRFLKEMRFFAKRRMMRFDTRDITKGNLNKDDFQFLSINGSKEATMNESSMYGSSKTSYRKLESTRLVVRHGKPVDENKSGDRSRHINALFIENSEGERFKYPFNHLAGAKAMQRHVANGGNPFDDAGRSIVKMSEQIAQLNVFKRHVKTTALNDDANIIHARASSKLQQLRDTISGLQGQKTYENWMESFVPYEEAGDLDPVTIEDYKNKFTVKQFDETLASVFPLIHSIMQEAGTLDLEEIVHEGEEDRCDECGMYESKCECDDEESTSEGFDRFEEWADAISEGTMTPDQLAQFKELVGSGLTLGPDGTSAIEALAGIGIEDEALENALKSLAAIDPQADPLETIEAWLKINDPEALAQLGGNQEQPQQTPPAEEPAPEVGGEIPSPEEQPVAEEDSNAQHVPIGQQMANDGITYSREKEGEIIDLMAQYMKKNGMSPKSIRYYLNYDEDYIPDQLSYLPREKKQEPEEDEQMDNAEPQNTESVSLKELAEFIGAFYNPNGREQGLGEWRKGPTELGIMASKQFGDKAGKIVELMVKKMQKASEGHQEFSEVMRLSGISKEAYNPNSSSAQHRRSIEKSHEDSLKAKADAGDEKAKKHLQALKDKKERMRNDYNDRMERESIETENGPKKSDIPAYLRKKSGDKDWNVTHADLEKDKERTATTPQGLAKRKKERGIEEELSVILKLAGGR